MSKVQCFKLPAGSLNNYETYIVINFCARNIFGFLFLPSVESVKRNIDKYIRYDEITKLEIINLLANNPEKVQEVEVQQLNQVFRWRAVMIKTPVSTYFDKDVYPYPQIDDADSNFISECNKEDTAKEIVKRINMYDELVKSLHDMIEIVGSNFCQNMEIKRKYKIARELLGRCK